VLFQFFAVLIRNDVVRAERERVKFATRLPTHFC